MTATTRHAPPGQRKHQLLAHKVAAQVHGIADAIVIKDDGLFLLCERVGRIPLEPGHGLGLFFHDCRYLSGYELKVGGHPLEGLGDAAPSGQEVRLETTNDRRLTDERDGTDSIEKQQLNVDWRRLLDHETLTLTDELTVHNRGEEDVSVSLDLAFAATFEDIFEIRGLLVDRHGDHLPPSWHDGQALRFAYDGADGICRTAWITFDPAPQRRGATSASWSLRLPRDGEAAIRVRVFLVEGRGIPKEPPKAKPSAANVDPPAPGSSGNGASHDGHEPGHVPAKGERRDLEGGTSLRSASLAFEAAIERSLGDLHTLITRRSNQRYFAAGVPWYVALFGRDSLIAGLQSLSFEPEIAAETLRLLASLQGDRFDDWRDEEPGKILHELRVGEYANLDLIPQTPYYGSVDSTPLFLILVAQHASWTGSLDLFRELRPNVDRALAWLDGPADRDGDGYIEYGSRSEGGLANQGWKDSGDAIVNRDGSLAHPPIRLPEVQGYAYLARQSIADLLDANGEPEPASELRSRAAAIQAEFEHDFWSDELRCYVLALQGDDRQPAEVVASNSGQVLWSGISSPDHADGVVTRLLADDMDSGWGIRTFAKGQRRYNPIGYHLGTVWPHDNSIIAAGFKRYGHDQAAEKIFMGVLEAAMRFPAYRLPETFAGFGRTEFPDPIRYPVACHPQAWASGALPFLLMTMLGAEPDGLHGRLVFHRPRLPRTIPWLELRHLRVGQGRVDVRFERDGQRAHGTILDGDGVEVEFVDDAVAPAAT